MYMTSMIRQLKRAPSFSDPGKLMDLAEAATEGPAVSTASAPSRSSTTWA